MTAQIVLCFCFLLIETAAHAEELFLRAGATGKETGLDWNNAWNDWSQISWGTGIGSLGAGDTLWVAGGQYGPLVPRGSGTSSNPIRIMRVLATDRLAASVSGWSASFDSQVVLSASSGSVLYFDAPNDGSYIELDGRIDSGIKLKKANVAGDGGYPGCIHFATGSANQREIVFRNIDLSGPEGSEPIVHLNYDQCLSVRAWDGKSQFNTISNISFYNCRFHGGNNLVILEHAWNFLFDHCKFYDNVGLPGSAGHQNVIEYVNSGNVTFRYCEFWNWTAEGIMVYGSSTGPLYVYGSVFRDAVQAGRVTQAFSQPQGPLLFYNNTCVNIPLVVHANGESGGGWAAGSEFKNNLYWNCLNIGTNIETYAFADQSVAGSNNFVGNDQNPFEDFSSRNLQIITNLGLSFPRNNGVELPGTYSIDPNKKIRGYDGRWDIGAFER